MAAVNLSEVQCWLTSEQVNELYSAAYWNDIEEERKKEFWIEDGKYEKCWRYLDSSQALREFRQAESFVQELDRGALKVVDLAAGTGWTSALLSKIDSVAQVHAVEMSRHRLERLFPHSVLMFDARADKISRYLGSFYDLRFPDRSMDVIFLSQAFHHADRPLHLLVECDRVLKPSGCIILTGEPHISLQMIASRFLARLVKQRRVITRFRTLFPPDPVLGDHYYRHADYELMFSSLGYRLQSRTAAPGHIVYAARKGP